MQIHVRAIVAATIVVAWMIGQSAIFAGLGGPEQVRELLELHGIDRSQLDYFRDGELISANEEETLIRILQRFPRFPKEKLERWGASSADWKTILSASEEHRAGVFQLRGRVQRIERVPVPSAIANRLEFKDYFRVTVRLNGPPQQAVVYTRFLPRAWETATAVNEPGQALGIFLKRAHSAEGGAVLVFVAERMAWLPERVNGQLGTTDDQVYLASLGFDVGLLDAARTENRKPLSLADRECFYRMLAAVAKSQPHVFAAKAQQPIELVSLLNDPDRYHGELLRVDGIARRAIRVRVDDPDIRERFGIDEYFQIDLFLDLDKQVIEPEKRTDGSHSPVFKDSYPVTVCVPSLPPNLPEGDVLRENIRVHATFFKLWSYPSDYLSSFDKTLLQVSPMLIGVEPQLVKLPEFNPGFGIGLAVVVVISAVGLWIGLRRQGTSTIKTAYFPSTGESVAGESLPQLPERPDFSGLESFSKPEDQGPMAQ